MSTTTTNPIYKIYLNKFETNGAVTQLSKQILKLEFLNQIPESVLLFSDEQNHPSFKYIIGKDVEFAKFCHKNNHLLLNTLTDSLLLQFLNESDFNDFTNKLKDFRTKSKSTSVFDQRTDESSSTQYFQFYSYLSQQQNMMQDYIRTSTYQRAIFENYVDFNGKVVLDVGAGSGILSFFAAQSGAKRVYAIEASSMAQHAQQLVKENKMSEIIKIIAGKIEEINLPEQVDVIISEPMGYMLYNERMLESFLHAKKFLKPNGKMYPTQGDLYIIPFNDEALYMEQITKANFWSQSNFYGIDLASLKQAAYEEYFKQPIVDTFDIRVCISKPVKHTVNFLTANESDLYVMNIPLKYDITAPVIIHGLAFWFDVVFIGSYSHVWLSTSPTQQLTHWYQVRCLLPQPFLISAPTTLLGHVTLKSNKKQSYDVEISLNVEGSSMVFSNVLDLKNPFFRYTGQPVAAPPGYFNESPTEQYFTTTANQTQTTQNNIVIGNQKTTNNDQVQQNGTHHQQQQQPQQQQQVIYQQPQTNNYQNQFSNIKT